MGSRFLIIVIAAVLLSSFQFCTARMEKGCEIFVDSVWRSKKYDFVFQEKFETNADRHYHFIGTKKNGDMDTISEWAFDKLYKDVLVGDTIRKDSGRAYITLYRGRDTIEYFLYCHGQKMY